MCRGSECTELGTDRTLWSRLAPLPPPGWFRREIETVHRVAQAAARGDVSESLRLLKGVRGAELAQWYVEHGQRSGFFRIRDADLVPRTARSNRGRMPGASTLRSVIERDGYRCRYCALPVVPLAVFRWLSRALGADAFRAEGSGNAAKHGAVIAFRANFDHVVPLALGGPNNEQNLVTCCWSCNYGKRAFTLAELGLDDPRDRPPLVDAWDGLVSSIPGLRATTQSRRGVRGSQGAT